MAKKTKGASRRANERAGPVKAATGAGLPHAPLFRAALAVSLDGYIAQKDGDVEWLHSHFSSEIDFAGFMKTIGATVYGRATYDEAMSRGYHMGNSQLSIVLTHRAMGNPPRGVEVFSGDVRELAARLRSELAGSGKDIWLIGGGRSIAAFHACDLVDRWELSVIPVLLGDGIPLFPRHSRGLEGLRLTHSRTLKNGIAELWYEPDRGIGRRAPQSTSAGGDGPAGHCS